MPITFFTDTPAHPKRPAGAKPSLMDTPGVEVGVSIVWEHGSAASGLTDREKELIREKTGAKTVNIVRALNVKQAMPGKTIDQITRHFRGRKGYGKRSIAAIHAALSQAAGEGLK